MKVKRQWRWPMADLVNVLKETGFTAIAFDGGIHYRIEKPIQIDFWPSTGRWRSGLGANKADLPEFRTFLLGLSKTIADMAGVIEFKERR